MGRGIGYRARQLYNGTVGAGKKIIGLSPTSVYVANLGLNAAGRLVHEGFDFFAGGTAGIGLGTKIYEAVFKDYGNKYVKAIRGAALVGATVLGGMEAVSFFTDFNIYDGAQAAVNLLSAGAIAKDMANSDKSQSVPKQVIEGGKSAWKGINKGAEVAAKVQEELSKRKAAKKRAEEEKRHAEEGLEGRLGSDGGFGSLFDDDYDIDID